RVVVDHPLLAAPRMGRKRRSAGSANNRYAFEEQWEEPVDEETFRNIVGRLAYAGQTLLDVVFDRDDACVAKRLREPARADDQVFTINAADFHLPWGMLYTHPDPNEKLAKDGRNFDRQGFWGIRHIIEQYTNRHRITDQLNAVDGKLDFGAVLHPGIAK